MENYIFIDSSVQATKQINFEVDVFNGFET